MIIFPHVPKTGGTSVRSALQLQLGPRLLLDYDHGLLQDGQSRPRPLTVEEVDALDLQDRVEVIYGHFAADHYRAIGGQVAMFFRNPRDRALSHYYYHRSMGRFGSMPLEKFLRRPGQVSVYARFLGGLTVDDIAFVGITEEFSKSVALFNKMFGYSLVELKERETDWEYRSDMTDILAETQAANHEIYEAASRRFHDLYNQHMQ